LIAIGAGAYAHAVHQAVRGARWHWLGTAVLALVLTMIASVADVNLGTASLVVLFVDPLLAGPRAGGTGLWDRCDVLRRCTTTPPLVRLITCFH
ncbi:MAG: hypothetical protein ACLQUY_21100, partial [Ktedonobacterales bacterium]